MSLPLQWALCKWLSSLKSPQRSRRLLFLISLCQNLFCYMPPRPPWSLFMFKPVMKETSLPTVCTPVCAVLFRLCFHSQRWCSAFCVAMTMQLHFSKNKGITRIWIGMCSWNTFYVDRFPTVETIHTYRKDKGIESEAKLSSAHELSRSDFPLRIELLLSWVKIHTCDICLAVVFTAAAASSFPPYTHPGLSHKDTLFI